MDGSCELLKRCRGLDGLVRQDIGFGQHFAIGRFHEEKEKEVGRYGHFVLANHFIFDVASAITLFFAEIERSCEGMNGLVLLGQVPNVVFEFLPIAPVESGSLGGDIGQKEGVFHRPLGRGVGGGTEMASVIAGSFVIAFRCADVLGNEGIFFEIAVFSSRFLSKDSRSELVIDPMGIASLAIVGDEVAFFLQEGSGCGQVVCENRLGRFLRELGRFKLVIKGNPVKPEANEKT